MIIIEISQNIFGNDFLEGSQNNCLVSLYIISCFRLFENKWRLTQQYSGSEKSHVP